jgi:potassium efflux system protein
MKNAISIFSYCLLLLLLLGAINANAAVINNSYINPGQSFNPNTANKFLDQFGSKLSVRKNLQQLHSNISALTTLSITAKKCVEDSTKELETINKSLSGINAPPLGPIFSKNNPLRAEQKYLNTKKEQLTSQLSACRLFLLRSDEIQLALQQQLRTVLKTRLLYAEPDILINIKAFPSALTSFLSNFNRALFINKTGVKNFTASQWTILFLLLLTGWIASQKLKKIIQLFISTQTETRLYAQWKQALLSVFTKYLPFLFPIAIFALFLTLISRSTPEEEFAVLRDLSYAILSYLAFLMVIRFLFYPPKPSRSFIAISEQLAKILIHRLKRLAGLCLIAYSAYVLLHNQIIPDSLLDLSENILVTLLAISLISIIWLIKKTPRILYHHPVLRFLITLILSTLLSTILVTEWLGYHLLAIYILRGVALTLLAAFIARLLHKITTLALDNFQGSEEHQWQHKLRRNLGLRSNDRLIELLWLRLLCYLLIWCGLGLYLLKIWGLGQTNLQSLLSALLHGFQIAQIQIVPLRILIGILFFILLSIATRLLRTYIAKTANLELAQGNRESLASIVGYIGFAIAILIGLLVAGVNFSGLAIIAGALSVGIGFGLQNIVNNFVSGVILLIERPIKPGDRIIVGDTEGYVRKISIRSTNIITTHRADVIVPNSELVSKQVTNFMLYDTNFLISTSVGVAYGSDIQAVKKLLLEIAQHHSQIITNRKGFEPQVYFRKFGDNSLEFELVCLITDVNIKSDVQSDLNFAIEKIFHEHKIEIAFPQRVITVSNWPKTVG